MDGGVGRRNTFQKKGGGHPCLSMGAFAAFVEKEPYNGEEQDRILLRGRCGRILNRE